MYIWDQYIKKIRHRRQKSELLRREESTSETTAIFYPKEMFQSKKIELFWGRESLKTFNGGTSPG